MPPGSHTSDIFLAQLSTIRRDLSRDDLIRGVEGAIANQQWATVAAFGARAVESSPGWLQGYIFQFDGYLKLGLFREAAAILDHAERSLGKSDPIFVRRVALSNALFRWDETESAYLRTPQFSDSAGAGPIVFLASLSTKNFEFCRRVLQVSKMPEQRKAQLHADLERDESDWKGIQQDLDNVISSGASLADILSAQDFRLIPALAWRLYQEGRRDIEFFQFATSTVGEEIDSSPRLMFLRQSAAEHHPDRADFASRAARALIQKGRVQEAFKLLDPHVRFQRDNDEFLRLWLRARDAAGARPEDGGVISTPISLSLGADTFSTLEAIRCANIAKWQGDAEAYGMIVSRLARSTWTGSVAKSLSLSSFGSPAAKSRPKPAVAICISGQMRSFSTNWPSIRDNLVSPLGGDLFIHTWDTQSLTPPRFARINRFLPDSVVARLPAYLHNPPDFKKCFPRTYELLVAPLTLRLDRGMLQAMTAATEIAIDAEDTCAEIQNIPERLMFNGKPNQVKMFYKTHACDRLRQAIELHRNRPYDVVIRTRPDLDIEIPHLEYYIAECISHPDRIYTSYLTADGCGDQFAIGSPTAMKVYASVWEYLQEYQRFDYLPGFLDTAAEPLLGQHLLAHGLEVRLATTTKNILMSDLVVHHVDIRDALYRDISEGLHTQDVMPFFNAYVEWHANERLNFSTEEA